LIATVDLTDLTGLRAAAHADGAFLLAVDEATACTGDDILALSRRLFALPAAELDAIAMVRSPYFRGYNRAGSELTQGRADQREQLDLAPELAPLPLAAGDPPYRRLQGPNQWPAGLPALRPAIVAWMDRLREVATALLDALLASVQAEGASLAAGCAPNPHTRLKIIRYPGADADDDDQGVGEHRDSGVLTLILGDDAPGLQIRRSASWVDVPAPRGTLVVVLGRTLESATRGYFTAPSHRVVSPPRGGERYSVPFFFSPRLDYVVEPLRLPPELGASPQWEAPADAVSAEYGYSALEVLVRSHPDVARRHHPAFGGSP
jgi:isopenicillin N synthase-like dioxygenase